MNSIKNKRQLSKIETNKKILLAVKSLILKNGVLNVSTLEIAKKAGIAHGTVFSHFATKEMLMIHFFREESKKTYDKLSVLTCDPDIRLRELLSNYLTILMEEEELHVAIAREFPFYPKEIKEELMNTEHLIKNLMMEKLKNGISKDVYKNINVDTAISYLFGTVNYILSRKDILSIKGESILKMKKQLIVTTFFQLITNELGRL